MALLLLLLVFGAEFAAFAALGISASRRFFQSSAQPQLVGVEVRARTQR